MGARRTEMHFQKISPEEKSYKWYSLELDEQGDDLFASPTVTIRRGRIGQQGEVIQRHFPTVEAAHAFLTAKSRERLLAGYLKVETPSSSLSDKNCALCALVASPELHSTYIVGFPKTVFFLSWDQTYPGRSMVVFKSHIPDFFRLAPSELLAILPEIRQAEEALRKTFGTQMMNYLFMGNTAQHVHLHLVPRSETDPNFGSSPFLDTQRVKGPQLAHDEYRAISKKIADSLGGHRR
jgi:diadenosine tetraphosphate (Ap4A) HIT family hydrolase/predicted DNA-binding WGR domain protein